MSRFKSERSRLKPSSMSLGANIIPAEQVGTVKRAIRYGKLDGNNLVGDDRNSEEDEEEEMMNYLRKGSSSNADSNATYNDTNVTSRDHDLSRNTVSSSLPSSRSWNKGRTEESTPQMNSIRSSPKLPLFLDNDFEEMDTMGDTAGNAYPNSPTLLNGSGLKVMDTLK